MPTYRVTAPDGRSVRLTGDSPPSEAELEEIFAQLPQAGGEPSPAEPAPEPRRGALSRLVSGAAKQVPLTAMDAAALMQRPASTAADALAEFLGLGEAAQKARDIRETARYHARAPYEPTEDEGTAGAVGRGITKAAPAMGLAALTGGASVPVQAAALGVTGGTQAAAEGGDVVTGTVGGAVAPVVGPVAGKVIGAPAKALGRGAVRQFERGLGATKEAMKTEAARITPELLERGVHGSLQKLLGMAKGQVDDLGEQIKQAYKAATKSETKINAKRFADALEPLKTPFIAAASFPKPEPLWRQTLTGQRYLAADEAKKEMVALSQQAIRTINDLQGILRKLGPSVTPSTLWKFRKTVDDVVSASNGFTRELPRGTAKALQKQVRAILQEELGKAVPNVQRLNTEFRLWKGLQDVAGATLKRRTSQERSLIPALGAVVGVGVGTGATGGMGGAMSGAILLPMLIRATRSPAWRTTTAVIKRGIADIMSEIEGALQTEWGRKAATFLVQVGGGATREVRRGSE